MNKLIEFNSVYFNYETLTILENINLTINKGDFIGVIGPNGSGKTTFLKLLVKQLKPSLGSIAYKDDFNIGYVEQLTLNIESSFPYSVKEVVLMGLYPKIGLFRFPKKEHIKKLDETLELLGITHLKYARISELSGGQQQKVMIAKAIISNPSLLILDEAFNGIDHDSVHNLYKILCQMNKKLNMAILFVSHHFDDKSYLNRIFELNGKHIIETKMERSQC